MSKADKLLNKMKANPRDWSSDQVRTVAKQNGLIVRQRGTSHAVLVNSKGQYLSVPMHKPIKPLYIEQLIELIEN